MAGNIFRDHLGGDGLLTWIPYQFGFAMFVYHYIREYVKNYISFLDKE